MTTLKICINIDDSLDEGWRNRIKLDAEEALEEFLNSHAYDTITYEWEEHKS